MNKQSVIVTILFMLAIEDFFNLANPIANGDKKQIINYKKAPEERRKLPLFPKTNKKFVITEPVQKQPYSVPEIHRPIKKPLLPKFIINNKKIHDNDWYHYKIPVTRRSLMKPVELFVDTVTTHPRDVTINRDESLSDEYVDASVSQSHEHETINASEAEEILTEEDDYLEEQLYHTNEEFITESYDEIVQPSDTINYLGDANTFVDDSMMDNSDIDKSEFIFIAKENNIEKSQEEYTTIDPGFSDKTRSKRNINIIEEENGTTLSAYKYTGKVSHSANDLSYNNINL